MKDDEALEESYRADGQRRADEFRACFVAFKADRQIKGARSLPAVDAPDEEWEARALEEGISSGQVLKKQALVMRELRRQSQNKADS